MEIVAIRIHPFEMTKYYNVQSIGENSVAIGEPAYQITYASTTGVTATLYLPKRLYSIYVEEL